MEINNFNHQDNKIELSVIVPVYNEQEVLPTLFERLHNALKSLPMSYEVIFIDDGSVDDSLKILESFCLKGKQFKTISFSRNFGHQLAVSAGLDLAFGEAVVIIDADLQDPPELIANLVKKWQEGYKVVYTIRKKRKENLFKRVAYKIYYQLLHKLADINIPLDSGDFCLMDQKVVKLIRSLPERTRFIRGLRSWVGFKQIGIEYERDKRFAGKPKYTFSKLLTLALDGIISFSGAPLRLAVFFGFIVSSLSLAYGIYIIASRLLSTANQIPGWASLLTAVMFLGGIQLVIVGLVGEYITRIFNEVKGRPLYIVDKIIGFDSAETQTNKKS